MAAVRGQTPEPRAVLLVERKRARLDHRQPGNGLLFGGGGLVHAWPINPTENEYSRVRASKVETLLIGGSLDFAAPPQAAAKELLPYLTNGHQVILGGLGHTTSVWGEQTKASAHLMNTFFDTGKVDDSLYTHQAVDFTPDVTQTALGKGIGIAMMAFALIVVLSLLLMWRRVHKRGGFGRKASATLRSVYLLVLGLGGWLTGLMIVLVAFPTVPLDNALLAVLSIGTPIASGRTSPGSTRTGRPGPRPSAWRRQQRAPSLARGSDSTQQPGSSQPSPRSSERPSAPTWPCSRSTSRGIGRFAIVSQQPTRRRCWRLAPHPVDRRW